MSDHTLDIVEPPAHTPASGATVRLGTRRSVLARTQSVQVARRLAESAGFRVEIVEVVTEGDVNMAPLAQMGGTGVFVSAVRTALQNGTIDIAVHSLKDLPTAQPPEVLLAAIPDREDPRDALLTASAPDLASLPPGARVGTGSPRRATQLAALRPDLEITGLRGNIDTRIGYLREGRLDAILLAAAGLRRVGREAEVAEFLDPARMLPAPGQGALAVECRPGDGIAEALAALDHAPTRAAVTAERAVLARAEAGCSAPIGALARWQDAPQEGAAAADRAGDAPEPTGRLTLDAVLADDDGRLIRRSFEGTAAEAQALGERTADALLAGLAAGPDASTGRPPEPGAGGTRPSDEDPTTGREVRG